MNEIILITREELVEIIDNCLAKYIEKKLEPSKEQEQKFLYSIQELADFLGCSPVTAQKLKNKSRIRYLQFGRKIIFNSNEILEDLSKHQ